MNAEPADVVIDLESVGQGLLEELVELYPGQPYKQAIWSWQFMPRFGRDCLAVTARESGRLVGFNGLMPAQLAQGDVVEPAWWSCDFIVDSAHQGRGVGSRIKDTMLQRISEPVLSLGISNQAWPILLRKGWLPGPQLPLYERVFKPQRKRQWLFKCWSDGVWAVQGVYQNVRQTVSWKLELRDQLPEPEQMEKLWQRWRPRQQLSVVRDHAYMHWRYQSFPFGTYHYLLIRGPKSDLQGILIFRYDAESRAEITDYLGPSDAPNLVCLLTRKLREEGAKTVLWRVVSPDLQRLLLLSGYIKKRYATSFVYRPLNGAGNLVTWRLTSGDSDGDFLNAAQDHLQRCPADVDVPDGYRVHELDADGFDRCGPDWDRLMKQSHANPLFMSWQWQHNWWLVWGKKLNLDLRCFFIYSGDRMVGILPLFQASRGVLRPKIYQFLGNAWRLAPTVRSEYIEPIFARDHEQSLYTFLEQWWIKRMPKWSCFTVPDHVGPMTYWRNSLVRQSDRGYRIPTQGKLDDYLAGLGKNTRLRAFNRQEYLQRCHPDAQWGEFDFSEAEIQRFFSILNAFHEKRWGLPCFSPDAVEFHSRFIRQRGEGVRPLLHYLKVDGRIRSLSYNIWVAGVLYNLQSGFESKFDPKLSLGTLHFGKLINLCFADPETRALDLLAGTGKHTDYKDHFNGERIHFNCVQILPNRSLYWTYRLVARGKAKLGAEKGAIS